MTQNINRSPQIFLSYSHKDKQWVDIFVRKLKSAGVNIWFDENEIKPGDTWREKLEEGLRLSDSIIMILSPESVSSSNLSFELGAALGMGKRIIPIVDRGIEASAIPGPIRHIRYLMMEDPEETAKDVAEALA